MSFRAACTRALVAVLVLTSFRAFAGDDSFARENELMDALRIIAARDGGWSFAEWQDVAHVASKYAPAAIAVTVVGGALYYFKAPRGFRLKSLVPSNAGLEKAQEFITSHGGKFALVSVGGVLAQQAVARVTAMNNVTDAERLRSASTPDARVYRSHLRQFFRLRVSEQFLIARQDPVLTEDLIRLAHWIEARNPPGLRPR